MNDAERAGRDDRPDAQRVAHAAHRAELEAQDVGHDVHIADRPRNQLGIEYSPCQKQTRLEVLFARLVACETHERWRLT